MMKYFSVVHSLQNPVVGLKATFVSARMLHLKLKGTLSTLSWPQCLLSLVPDLWFSGSAGLYFSMSIISIITQQMIFSIRKLQIKLNGASIISRLKTKVSNN